MALRQENMSCCWYLDGRSLGHQPTECLVDSNQRSYNKRNGSKERIDPPFWLSLVFCEFKNTSRMETLSSEVLPERLGAPTWAKRQPEALHMKSNTLVIRQGRF